MKNILLIMLLGTLPLFGGEDYKLYKTGKKAWYGENWKEATSYFKKVLKNYPESSFYKNSLYYLGSCQFKQANFEEAFDYLSEYLEIRGSATAFQDAEEMRLQSAFKLAKTKPFMKNVLRESLKGKDIDQAIQSAALLLKLGDSNVIDELFKQLDHTKFPRSQKKLIGFIEENGSLTDQKKLRLYVHKEKPEIVIKRNKMIHLIVREHDQEVLNISLPLSFVEYFKDCLSEDQIIMIEKTEKTEFENLLKLAKGLSEGEVLLKISGPEGDIIKIVVE